MVPEVITTERLVLRPLRASDVEDVLEYAADPEWRRHWIALPDSAYTRADAERYIEGCRALDRSIHAAWGIEYGGRIVGGVDVRFFHGHRIAELGYGLAPRLWGRGLVLEAARGVIAECFGTYPELARVRAVTDARNTRSLRVMEKLGMQREGLLRSDRFFRGELVDEVVCGLLRSEWAG